MQAVEKAWVEDFYKKQFPITRGCLSRLGLNQDDIDDLLQDALISSLKSDRNNVKSLAAYFHTSAINAGKKRLSELNKFVPEQEIPADDTENTLVKKLETTETNSCIAKTWQALTKKHPEHAEILHMIINHGWSGKQIAHYLNKKEDTARQYCLQARKYYQALLYTHCKAHFSTTFWENRGYHEH